MDDIGSEQLCKLSCNQDTNKNEQISAILNCNTASTATTTVPTTTETGVTLGTTSTLVTTTSTATSSLPVEGVHNHMIIVKRPNSNNKSNKNYNRVTEEEDKMMCNKNSATPVTTTMYDASTSTTNSSNNSLPLMDVATPSIANSYPYSMYSYDNNDDCSYSLAAATVTAITTTSSIDEDSDEKEKTDVTPENVKKLDDVIMISNKNNNSSSCNEMSGNSNSSSRGRQKATTKMRTITAGDNSNSGGDGNNENDDNIELKMIEDESPTKQCLAFTIEFTNEGETSSSSTAARYKNMVERFQSRHRRGASLSKLDDGYHNQDQNNSSGNVPSPNTGRTSRVMYAQHQRQLQQQNSDNSSSEANKVKLRIRERSTSGVRDASKRHSWSPRSSTHEPLELQTQHQLTRFKEKQQISKGIHGGSGVNDNGGNSHMNSRQNIKSSTRKITANLLPPRAEKNINFTSHSNALQLQALNKLEFLCPEPPLDDFTKKTKNVNGDDDDCETVNEAGTYTVDGDNYTEEQKEQMNIDKSMSTYTIEESSSEQLSDLITKTMKNQVRPNELSLHHTAANNINSNINLDSQKQNNILELNYYHDSTSLKPKVSYLKKIKSKVRNIMTKLPDKKLNSPSDVGIFTSVTTSGILSIKPHYSFSIFPQHYSADEYSPTHTTRHHYNNHHSSGHHHHVSNVHKRNLSLDYRNNLMSHSLNTETLVAILSNDKKRTNERNQNQNNRSTRQHSYDGITGYGSPKLFQRKNYIDQTGSSLSSSNKQQFQQQQQQSPIRRSSSFSTRPMSSGGSSGRQQHVNSSSGRSTHKSTETMQNPIQKSASSTSFRKIYSDYDDSIAYYINDEDNLIDVEYCGSSDDYDDSDHGECYPPQLPPPPPAESEPSEPLTNTRYNKALLMRIERSKQRVAGLQGKPSNGGGVMACPNTPQSFLPVQSVPKQKEVELAMWRRRATYDPMKSAAEDRKRKEEAKRLAQLQGKSTESSVVSRSQSFHSGVTLTSSSSSSTTATTTATVIGNFRARLNRDDRLKCFKMDENDDIIDDDEDLNVNDDDDDFIDDNPDNDDDDDNDEIDDDNDDQNKLVTNNKNNKSYRWTLISTESSDGNDDDNNDGDVNINIVRDNNKKKSTKYFK